MVWAMWSSRLVMGARPDVSSPRYNDQNGEDETRVFTRVAAVSVEVFYVMDEGQPLL